MALYLIGIGLNDEKDISLKGLEIIKKCDAVYLESYTSKLSCPVSYLEKLYGKKLIIANREMVEKEAESTILKNALSKDVAFLVIGDPLSATTHIDLLLRAKKLKIKTKVVYNASILTAIGITGLQLYKFGRVASIPFDNENVETPYEILRDNQKIGLHTLFLLDLDPAADMSEIAKPISEHAQKPKVFDRFLTISDAIRYLLKTEIKRNEKVFGENSFCVGCARISSEDQEIRAGSANDLLRYKFKNVPQCLIVPGKLHFMEEEMLGIYRV